MSYLFSPDTETFSTPPTTPGPADMPSLSRRNSRPSTLQIDQSSKDWNPDLEVEASSPEVLKHTIDNLNAMNIRDPSTTPKSSPAALSSNVVKQQIRHERPMNSPCFVHSNLDKGASFTDWIRTKQGSLETNGLVSRMHEQTQDTSNALTPTSAAESRNGSDGDDSEDYGGSLTKQLAETAVGVREMSKQLGRARVKSNIQNVLIITKARDNRLIKLTRQLALYLMLKDRPGHTRGLVVYVDNQLRKSRRFDAEGIERDHPELFLPFPSRRTSSSTSLSSMSASSSREDFQIEQGQLRYWTSDMCSQSPHLFDFVVTLGGDGTVLFTSWLFQRIVPPVLPFALGSLGFLTNFDFVDHQAVMDSVIDSGIRVNLRMRFTCTVYRAVAAEDGKGRKAVKNRETGEIMMKNVEKGGWEALEGGWSGAYQMPEESKGTGDKEIMCFTTRPAETFEILNDLVVDRGPSPYVSLLELFGDEHHMTTVQADGLTVSTPTGSTAYSLSAGGSLVHPEIPAILITPICPHTLSFRPMLLPDSMELRICVPFNSRSTAWASFDGRGRVELKQGDHIKVTASKFPFPTVCADKQSTDWFHAISRTLKWNERERQKSFVVVEEGPEHKPKKRSKTTASGEVQVKVTAPEEVIDEEEEDEVSEEEDAFDIDDSSPEAAAKARESARGLTIGKKRQGSKSRSRSRSSVRSGVNTPGRYAGANAHPPAINHKQVGFAAPESSDSGDSRDHQTGARDDIYPFKNGGRSRIPKDRDFEAESAKTPIALIHNKTRNHQRTASEQHGRRAFAVWGHDESDASDSDAHET